mgnify:CR=1 FL=1
MGKFSKMHCAKNPFKFKTHKMYKGDKVVVADTQKEHEDLGEKGYGHTPPPTKKTVSWMYGGKKYSGKQISENDEEIKARTHNGKVKTIIKGKTERS